MLTTALGKHERGRLTTHPADLVYEGASVGLCLGHVVEELSVLCGDAGEMFGAIGAAANNGSMNWFIEHGDD